MDPRITSSCRAGVRGDGRCEPASAAERVWRVLLVNPPFQRLKRVQNVYFPLGLGYLAGGLKAAGFCCRILNAENPQTDTMQPHNHLSLLEQHHQYIQALQDEHHYVWQELRQTIQDFAPDILGVSVMTPVYGAAVRVNKVARALLPDLRIVWGGPHPTVQAREVLCDEPEVDFVVLREGEVTLVELCNALRAGRPDLAQVAGIAYRGPAGVHVNQARELVTDLDALAPPDKSADLNLDVYARDPERAALGNLFTSRGCPFRCAYCSSHTVWGRRVRYRTPASVVAEMQHLQREYGVERFTFLDDTFTMNRAWVTAVCDAMLAAGLKVRWGCYTRLDILSDELLLKMRAAGLAEMDVGIETGSQRMADKLQKNIQLDRVREMARVLNRRHINWNAFIMMGLPDETEADIQATVDFIHEVKPVRCILSVFTPYPGDALFDLCRARGLIPDKPEWWRFSHHSPENCFVQDIPKAEFERLVHYVFTLIDRYNNSWGANRRLFRANARLYVAHPLRLVQKAWAAARRMIRTAAATKSASRDLARFSGRGAGV